MGTALEGGGDGEAMGCTSAPGKQNSRPDLLGTAHHASLFFNALRLVLGNLVGRDVRVLRVACDDFSLAVVKGKQVP